MANGMAALVKIVINLLVLCISIAQCQQCRYGPTACSFDYGAPCTGWTFNHPNTYSDRDKTGNWYVVIDTNGYLQSDSFCSTLNIQHCLQFQYMYYLYKVGELDLIVQLFEKTLNGSLSNANIVTETVIDNVSSEWKGFQLPVTANTDFYIKFSARSNATSSLPTRIQLDNINYTTSACPQMSNTTTQIPSTQHEFTSRSAFALQSSQKTISSEATPSIISPSETPSDAIKNPEATGTDKPTVAVVIISVIGTLVVLNVIVIAIIIVLRRRNPLFWQCCFERGKRDGKTGDQETGHLQRSGQAVSGSSQGLAGEGSVGGIINTAASASTAFYEPVELDVMPEQNYYNTSDRPRYANAGRGAPRTPRQDQIYSDASGGPQYANAASQLAPRQGSSDQIYTDTPSRPQYANAAPGHDHAQPGQDYYNVTPTPQNPTGLYESLQRVEQNYEYTSLGQPSTTAARGIYESLQRGAGSGENYEYTTLGKP